MLLRSSSVFLSISLSWKPTLAAFLLICFGAAFVFSQTQKTSYLELGKTSEREISGDQKHLYKIKLSAKQFVKIDIEQRGIDIVARLFDPNGQLLTHYDLDPRSDGKEEVIMTSDALGEYKISISPRQKTLPTGRYKIHFIESRPALEKEIAIDQTRRLYTKGNNLWRSRKIDEALKSAEQSLKIWEEEIGGDDPEYYRVYLLLGNIYLSRGDFKMAESFYQKAIELNERSFGKNHISINFVINNLGVIYNRLGDYPKAKIFYRRTLEIREKALEPNHLLLSRILNNLGALRNTTGDKERAASYYSRALEIRVNALGEEHPEVARILHNIGALYMELDNDKADHNLSRSLAISEKVYGAEHPEVAKTLYALAYLKGLKKEYREARIFCQRSLPIYEKHFGPEHPLISYPLNLLAVLHKISGEYEKAESLFIRAINIKLKTEGEYSSSLGNSYQNLAALYAVQGNIEMAVSYQKLSNEINEYNLGLNLLAGSEKDKLNYVNTLWATKDRIFSLNFQIGAKFQSATNLGATLILQRKGRVLDAMSDNLGGLRRRFTNEDQKLLDDLNKSTKDLADFILAGPKTLKATEYRREIEKRERQRENLENEISRRSAGFYSTTKSIELETVLKTLPPKTTLLEFSVYHPADPQLYGIKKTPDRAQNPRYIVYVISSANEVKGKDLGDVEGIDKTIVAYRRALQNPKSKDAGELGRAVDEKLLKPIRSLLVDSEHLLISPDGLLNLMPFEALVDERGKFLVENFAISYLTSGRDLLRLQIERESKTNPILVANPTFGAPLYRAEATSRITVDKRRSITATRDLSDTYFAPLDATKQEGESIKKLFPQATFLTQEKATETELKKANAPSILHIATHGFFLEDVKDEVKNPLLRSGLAFAGANQRKSGEDDGILTALEASGLNLWGTKLVVLSACDTGLGEVRNGEGVYGLRRAFTLAGTESLVMSLWAVSDYVTRELMTDYYQNLKKGMGRNEALRRVQLKMLKKKTRQHPFYWASFIQSGEWANLDGKR